MFICTGALALGQGANAAVAAPPLDLSVNSTTASMSGRTSIAVRATAGPEGAEFGLEYALPKWPGSHADVGSPLRVTAVDLIGPGDLRGADPAPPRPPVFIYRETCNREVFSTTDLSLWPLRHLGALGARSGSSCGLELRPLFRRKETSEEQTRGTRGAVVGSGFCCGFGQGQCGRALSDSSPRETARLVHAGRRAMDWVGRTL